MDEEDKKLLLQVAKESVGATVKGISINEQLLKTKGHKSETSHGTFVTLKTHGKLRGCIGKLTSNTPLPKLVSEMAVSAVLEDTRFQSNRIKPSELGDLEIEVSILTPLQKIEDPLDLELGKHGIYIKKGPRNGCFLPQVATETGWSKEEFLSQCCQSKVGLSPNAWKEKDTEVYVFTAEIITK